MKRIFIATLSILLLAVGACNKCKQGDKNEGIIVKDYGGNSCLSFMEDNVVITSQAQLDSIGAGYQITCDTPTIDFTAHSLLVFKCGTGCITKFERRVDKDPYVPKYLYMLTVYHCDCKYKASMTNYNAVLVPALPQGYTVEFVQYDRP